MEIAGVPFRNDGNGRRGHSHFQVCGMPPSGSILGAILEKLVEFTVILIARRRLQAIGICLLS
jgi:hypothetical protein